MPIKADNDQQVQHMPNDKQYPMNSPNKLSAYRTHYMRLSSGFPQRDALPPQRNPLGRTLRVSKRQYGNRRQKQPFGCSPLQEHWCWLEQNKLNELRRGTLSPKHSYRASLLRPSSLTSRQNNALIKADLLFDLLSSQRTPRRKAVLSNVYTEAVKNRQKLINKYYHCYSNRYQEEEFTAALSSTLNTQRIPLPPQN